MCVFKKMEEIIQETGSGDFSVTLTVCNDWWWESGIILVLSVYMCFGSALRNPFLEMDEILVDWFISSVKAPSSIQEKKIHQDGFFISDMLYAGIPPAGMISHLLDFSRPSMEANH